MNYYAHSGLTKYNIKPQIYSDHIKNMFNECLPKMSILSPFLRKAVLVSVLFHDFGKLDVESQKVLCQPDPIEGVKMINHVDAGVAWCINKYKETNDLPFIYAAYLIHAHHIGLQDRSRLFEGRIRNFSQIIDIKEAFRDNRVLETSDTVKGYVDSTLSYMYGIQESVLKKEIDYAFGLKYDKTSITPIELRFALSVLAELDHGDTSRHYGMPSFSDYTLLPEERLKKLKKEVNKVKKAAIKNGISKEVIDSRNVLFNECDTVDVKQNNFFVCAAPTGKGKTFSLMNLALRISKEKKKEKIFFIIPFTNIISQSVKNYRNCVVLKGEEPLKVVNEIHSKVEFQDWKLRKYSHLWTSPINVSTSVQFFDSLFSNKPSQVRKLMQFANSTIVFDEYHTALPHHLWKVVLHTLKVAAEKFNIDFVFGSGTHVYYWDIFSDTDINVKNVVSDKTFEDFKEFEKGRITFNNIGTMESDEGFYKEFFSKATTNGVLNDSALIVCNTVRNAVYITKYFKDNTDFKVYHLSSYLTPVDRELILDKVHKDLKNNVKILLVSTSVIECGVDVSFRVGFREESSMSSAIQFGGRVNRNKENSKAYVHEFSFDKKFIKESRFSNHPGLAGCISARKGIAVDPDNCTTVIKNEIELKKMPDLMNFERDYQFKSMKDNFSVIDSLTVSVIVNTDIINKIKTGVFVDPVQINRNSVSIYKSKIDPENGNNWCNYVSTFSDSSGEDVMYWAGPYDKDVYGVYLCEVMDSDSARGAE